MKLIAKGRAADVYEHSEGLVLRRYRNALDTRLEAYAMRYAHAHGFPVPAVHSAEGRDIVMERIDGPTMLADLSRRPWKLGPHAETLARLHENLHEIGAPDELPGRFGEGDRLLHTDLHPENVILGPRGPVVIDWTNACRGPAEADVAQTWVILATASAPGGVWQRALAGVGRKLFLQMFLSRFDRAAAGRRRVVGEQAQRDAPRTGAGPAIAEGQRPVAAGRGLFPSPGGLRVLTRILRILRRR